MRILALLLLIAAAVPARAALTITDVEGLVRSGAQVTIGNDFPANQVQGVIYYGRDRVTVILKGFTPNDALSFVYGGARVVVDSSFGAQLALQICSTGAGRAMVVSTGFTPADLDAFRRSGSDIIEGDGGATLDQKLATLRSGGKVNVRLGLAPRDVLTLISVGGARVAVIGKGYSAPDMLAFARAGAIVWLDSSFGRADVLAICRTATPRVVVLADGFALDELRTYAGLRVHIQMVGLTAAREERFSELYREPVTPPPAPPPARR